MRALGLVVLGGIVLGCGGGVAAARGTRHENEHEHEHHTKHHRFDDPESWAKEFDDPKRDEWQKPADVVALLELKAGMAVADLGAGTGYFLPHLSRAVGAEGSVIGLDVEPKMVAYMERRAAKEGLANVRVRRVPFDDPRLAPGSVDRILIVDTWHHIEAREAYAGKLRSALEPGGFVAIVDFTLESEKGPPRAHKIPPERIATELEAGGLRATVAVESLPDQYVVVGKVR